MLAMLVLILGPILLGVALLSLTDSVRRSRQRAIARQVMLTDAIHRELGAVVAPVVSKRMWGPWQILIAVPLAQPAVVASVVAIAHRALAFAGDVGPGRLRIVLTAQEGPRPRRRRADPVA